MRRAHWLPAQRIGAAMYAEFQRAIDALTRLQSVALRNRHAATWAAAIEAVELLRDARQFDAESAR